MNARSSEQEAAARRIAEHAAVLPVRSSMPGEDLLRGRWMDDHGAPSEWSEQTRLDYAAAVARLRARTLEGTR